MFDHIGIRVSDIAEASRFYDAVLPTLGYGRCSSEDEQVGYGADNQPAFWLHASSETGRGTHLAFAASDRSAVADFHAAGLKAGGTDNGAGTEAGLHPDLFRGLPD